MLKRLIFERVFDLLHSGCYYDGLYTFRSGRKRWNETKGNKREQKNRNKRNSLRVQGGREMLTLRSAMSGISSHSFYVPFPSGDKSCSRAHVASVSCFVGGSVHGNVVKRVHLGSGMIRGILSLCLRDGQWVRWVQRAHGRRCRRE